MKIAEPGLAIIKASEALRLKAYLPTKDDVPTIGYGHTRGVKLGDTCTLEQAEAWLREDCEDAENDVLATVKVPLTQNQFDALVSLVFNIGGKAFRASTLLKRLNAKLYQQAADQFPRWNKQAGKVLNGLTKRRARERSLFLKADGT